MWERDPNRARSLLGGLEDDVVLETGDAEIDEIERRLAAGEDPNVVLANWDVGSGKAEEEIDDNYAEELPNGTDQRK